ncbi:MAG: hypothetical protein GY868_19945 [Deltaproteobacteria bacterium]|nr:hypothetical protein [Deltaproteobacteria bacterium]
MGDKKSTIEKKELVGTEELDGYVCDKLHVVMTLANGTKTDTLAWLAKTLSNFPIKIVVNYETPQGMKGSNITRFSNITRAVPREDLFKLPKDYTRYETLLELATGGRLGKKLRERQERRRQRAR